MTNAMDLHINVWEEHFNEMKSSSPWTWDDLLWSPSIVQLHQAHGVQVGQTDFYRMARLWELRRPWYLLWDSPSGIFLLGIQNHTQVINLLKNQSLYPCPYLKGSPLTKSLAPKHAGRPASLRGRTFWSITLRPCIINGLEISWSSRSHLEVMGKTVQVRQRDFTHRCPLSLVGKAGTANVVALWCHFWLLEDS